MSKILFSIVLILLLSGCSKNISEIKNISQDDVYFYLSNYYIVNDSDQLKLTSIENKGDGYFIFTYKVKNNPDLWIKHYYDENNSLSNFIYRQSSEITKITDSINKERIKTKSYPLNKRWDLVATLPSNIK